VECLLSVFMIKKQKILITRYFLEKPLLLLKDIDSLMWAKLKSILPVKPAINKPALNLFFN
jgi:hypothetical protein